MTLLEKLQEFKQKYGFDMTPFKVVYEIGSGIKVEEYVKTPWELQELQRDLCFDCKTYRLNFSGDYVDSHDWPQKQYSD